MEEKTNKDVNYIMGESQKFFKAINPNQVTTNKNVVYFNAEKEDNGYLEQLNNFYNQASSVHSNLINLKRNLIIGNGVTPISPDIKTQAFLDKINKQGDNFNDVFNKSALDFALFEAACYQILYDSEGEISTVYHIDTSTVRAEAPDALSIVNNWYISKNWADISNKVNRRSSEKTKAVKVATFNPATWEEDGGVQLLYVKRYVSGQNVYSIPAYNSAIKYIQLDNELAVFELNKVSKGFFVSGILFMAGDPNDEQKKEFKNKFERKYMGTDADKLLYIWGSGDDEKPSFIRTEADKNDTLFNDLIDISAQKIATGHGANLELAGIEGKGVDLGGDANKLNTSLAYFNKNVIVPMQVVLLSGINKMLSVNGLGPVEITYTPLSVDSDNTEDEGNLSKEIKKELIKELT